MHAAAIGVTTAGFFLPSTADIRRVPANLRSSARLSYRAQLLPRDVVLSRVRRPCVLDTAHGTLPSNGGSSEADLRRGYYQPVQYELCLYGGHRSVSSTVASGA